MSMLNEIVAQLDYNYRLHQQENRLLRANQKLVTLGENSNAEAAYIVEMALDNLWDNMPIFFEKQGFTITDLDESDKKYFVDYIQPDSSLWDSIWGEEQSIIDLADDKYQFVLAPLDDKNQKTSVTIYQADGKPLAKETLERLFSVMELALSFKNIY